MSENSGTGIFAGISLGTIIQVGTLGAAIVAQWALMSSQLGDLKTQLSYMQRDLNAAELTIVATATRASVLETKYENLRDAVNELRRQSSVEN